MNPLDFFFRLAILAYPVAIVVAVIVVIVVLARRGGGGE